MSILLSGSLISSVISQIAQIEQQMVDENRKLLDLQSFASNIADGTISMNDMMSCPPSMFNRSSIFMQSSNQMAYMSAQQKMAYMSRIPGAMPQVNDPRAMQMYMQAMFKSFYDQGRQQIVQVEQKKLSVEESKIQQKISYLTSRKSMLEKMQANAEKDRDSSIDRTFKA